MFDILEAAALTDEQAQEAAQNLSEIDVQLINANFAKIQAQTKDEGKDKGKDTDTNTATAAGKEEEKGSHISPFTHTTVLEEAKEEEKKQWYEHGLTVIAQGKVSVLLMAGGQGTRLGSTEPKGCFDIGLPSKKSLFQIQAERITVLKQLAAKHTGKSVDQIHLPLYLMTSVYTHEPTIAFFQQHNFFGLNEQDVEFFQQGLYPCVDFQGKILMKDAVTPASAPDGNGGVYAGLVKSGKLQSMQDRGVEYVHFFGVDNVLVKVADPHFIGFAVLSGSPCSNKVVLKKDPSEKVGVMCLVDGKPAVVEYSEIGEEMSAQRDETTGELLYSAANIANHFFTVAFIADMTRKDLPLHIARKKIPCLQLDPLTKQLAEVAPTAPNGIKTEKFVFDVFQYAPNMTAFAVRREEEFTALKNKAGEGVGSSPVTAATALSEYNISLVEKAGGKVEREVFDCDGSVAGRYMA